MHPVNEPITGNEEQGNLSTPFQALAQFYYAFNQRDMDTMSRNWHQSEEIAMDNPLGSIKRGWNEIKEVYDRLFNGPAKVYVEYYDYTIHHSTDVFYAVGRERGYFKLAELKLDLAIRTSRIFKWVGGSWKQVHHHGSIEDPQLLKRYQTAVMKSG